MPTPQTQRFIDTLSQAEQTGDVTPLAALFAPDSKLHSYTRDERGRAADVFWKEYLQAFREVRSAFTRVVDDDKSAILEWESTGTLPNGMPIRYEGVTLLEFAGDRISRFRTYYDSAAFMVEGAAKHA